MNLIVTWDEYDDEDQNLVVFCLPNQAGATTVHENGNDRETNGENGDANDARDTDKDVGSDDGDDNWVDEDSEEDEEANEAVDRVLNKYEKADVVEDEEEDFDTRHERNVQEKMDEWKRGYYKVRYVLPFWRWITECERLFCRATGQVGVFVRRPEGNG